MCLYPTILKNKKYTKTKKNKGIIPKIKDERTRYVPVGCGKCIECAKQKANHWKIRLAEEIRNNTSGKFVTLTFSDEALNKFRSELKEHHKELIDNEIATRAVRLFLERWRKSHKKSIKHWLITELGHKNTERLHLHGILFTENVKEIEKIWSYGWVYIGQYVNDKTINYISKYVTKIDLEHKWFTGKILTSPGIGSNYINRIDAKHNKFNEKEPEKTNELYITRNGKKTSLPIYYRNKLYSEEEREQLWITKLDKEERWVCGEKVSIKDSQKEYEKLREFYRTKNKQLGYGSISWNAELYKKRLKKLKKNKNNTNFEPKTTNNKHYEKPDQTPDQNPDQITRETNEETPFHIRDLDSNTNF